MSHVARSAQAGALWAYTSQMQHGVLTACCALAVNLTTPADLVAAEATAAINAPPSPTDADRAVLNSVAAATNLTKALTDSMSQALNAFGYSPGSAGVQSFPLPALLASP